MKVKYFATMLFFIAAGINMQGQDISQYAFKIKGPVPKSSSNSVNRVLGENLSLELNYIQTDSLHFPGSYFMSYMFYMNSRYNDGDTGTPMTNQYLLRGFGVMFDTLVNASKDTAFALDSVAHVNIDSLHITIGHCNHSATQDTIVVQIDSIDNFGYPTPHVIHADTIYTSTGLSPSNEWLNPINITLKTNYPVNTNNTRFAVYVSYYGSKFDTMGFLPGFGYTTCHLGGSGPIPKQTQVGQYFGNLRANSYSTGYNYFFNDTAKTIPDSNGYMYGITINCADPESKYWYLQDNPITAYCQLTTLTGINEITSAYGYNVAQNQPNPFNKSTSIVYNLKSSANVVFSVYDLAGRQLLNNDYGRMAPGSHSISLDGGQFSPGIYLYTFNVNGSTITMKMVITR